MVPSLQAIQICTTTSVNSYTKVPYLFLLSQISSAQNWEIEGVFEAAETHFLASGTRDSARLLAEMMVEWSTMGGTPGMYALRGTIP
jgi:hypothetical protein